MRQIRTRLIVSIALLSVLAMLGGSVASAAGDGGTTGLPNARQATRPFHNLDVAMAAGYGPVKGCAKKSGEGGMGQHYVKGDLVGDPTLDKLRPEALVYAPRADGGYRLVAAEWIVLKDAWHEANGAAPPRLFGKRLHLVTEPNAYDLPDFYEIHAWIWKANSNGLFADWNPDVSCRGLPF